MKKTKKGTSPITILTITVILVVSTFIILASTSSCEKKQIETKAIEIIQENNGTMNAERFIEIMEAKTDYRYSALGGCLTNAIIDSERVINYGGGLNSEEKVEVIK